MITTPPVATEQATTEQTTTEPAQVTEQAAAADYRVSSFCTAGNCVEVGHTPGGAVTVRDAKDPLRATAITVSATGWAAFLAGVRCGEFPAG